MKCLIVDDENLARQRLLRLLEELGLVEDVLQASNGEQAIQLTHTAQPDIILMDIRMPGMDGIEAARHISQMETSPAIIFTTAYGDHALQAFETQAVDYLLKPIDKKRLAQALNKAARLQPSQLITLSENLPSQRNHLSARVGASIKLIPIEEVLYLHADNKYTEVASATSKLLIEESLTSLEKEFSGLFVRIHRNALVKKTAVCGLQKTPDGKHLIELQGIGISFEISRRMLPEVRKWMKHLTTAVE
ncbi:MAG: LytTR family DNA-binding domain-containing protein [Gammaproteobacteria bacterium]